MREEIIKWAIRGQKLRDEVKATGKLTKFVEAMAEVRDIDKSVDGCLMDAFYMGSNYPGINLELEKGEENT